MPSSLGPDISTTPDIDHWYVAREALQRLYGDAPGHSFAAFMGEVARCLATASAARPREVLARDGRRRDDRWFARPGRPAYSAYVDKFGGTLKGCIARIPYLQDLNVGLFHPLPLLKPRDGDSDGGFAVADFTAVDPRFGTFDDLRDLASSLRRADIGLVIDVVCNHTAMEHSWAQGWLAGDPAYADFYIALKDEAEMAAWSAHLVDVFPATAPGSFTYVEAAGGWVWTTFNTYQWDLNYANPRVFLAMLDVLFTLANAGVDGFRLDSVAYLWKSKGTICRGLDGSHDIVIAFRALLAMMAPGTFLLAEAIEKVGDVLPFFGEPAQRQCDMAYNNTAMAALWAGLPKRTAAFSMRP